MPRGNYTMRLLNNVGQVILIKQINNASGNSTEIISVSGKATGIYHLQVIVPDKSEYVYKVIIY